MADDAMCRRCGQCCFTGLVVAGVTIGTDIPCRFLDVETRLCTVYERRHEANPNCLTVEEGIKVSAFPADCPYVRDVAGYVSRERSDGTLVGLLTRVGRLLFRRWRTGGA